MHLLSEGSRLRIYHLTAVGLRYIAFYISPILQVIECFPHSLKCFPSWFKTMDTGNCIDWTVDDEYANEQTRSNN